MTGKEFERGYRWGKNYMRKFRSFKKSSKGIIGYKKSGGTERFGTTSELNRSYGTRGFSGGANQAFKESFKKKPTRKRKTSRKSGFSVNWRSWKV